MKRLTSITALLFIFNLVVAQNCGCTISQIENNTVAPCDITIGMVVTVSSVAEFTNAISQANNSGGNITILITDGTYQVAGNNSLTASNMVIRSVSGNRDAVILTGGGMIEVPSTEHGFLIDGNNVTIADLTIKEVGNHAIQVRADNLYVHNVKIQDTYQQMLKGSSDGDGADNGRVQCSLFEYTAGVGPYWYIGGIDVHKGNNWFVNDNIFKNIASPDSLIAEHAIHFWKNGADNIIERNVIINCDRGIGFGLGPDITDGNAGGVIRNNMIYNDGSGLFDDVGIGLEHSPGTKVYNNTIYIEDYPRAIEYRFPQTNNVEITNNLTNQSIASRNYGEATLTTNYTDAQSSWFINLGSGDLRLNSNNSTIVNQGTFLSEVSDDIDQTSRPQGASFDIGAYEYVEAVIDDCPPPSTQGWPLFQMNQLTYDGAFRLHNDLGLNYSQGPIAYNPDNHSLYIVGHSHDQKIGEFAIPQLVASNQIADLNISEIQLQGNRQVLDFTPDGNPELLNRISGLHYDHESNPPKLFVNAFNNYSSLTLTTLIVNDASNLAQSSLSGYYKFEGGGGHTSGWMSPIPTEWQTTLSGKMITGTSSGASVIHGWSVGPSAFSFDPQDFNNTDTFTPIPTNQLLDFSLDNPLADDLWTEGSRATYGFVVPNTRTYFTIGYSAAGHNYWLWDINDLIEVKNGNIASYDVLPYDYGIFDVPFDAQTKQIGGGSYDANTGQLYLSLQKADTLQGTYYQNSNLPLILVYNTNQSNLCCQTINLNPGWNLISIDVSPADKTVQSVFEDIIQAGNLEFITAFDNGAYVFDPDLPPDFNTLQEVEDGFGYWVKVQNADVLQVEGACLDNNFRKPFDAGWNLVAYPPDAAQATNVYFADLISNGNLEFVTGFDEGSLTFDPNIPLPFNTLQQMENGFGYWVKVTNASN